MNIPAMVSIGISTRNIKGSGGGLDLDEELKFICGFFTGLALFLIISISIFCYLGYRENHRHDGHKGHYEIRKAYKHLTKYDRSDKPREVYTYKIFVCEVCP